MTYKIRILLAVLMVVAFSVMACGVIGDSDDDEPYRIGVMESLTGPGETYGTVANQAKQLAVDEINAAGGVNGRMIELVVEDSKCGAQDAITAYNKLTDVDGVKIILGTSCSGAMLGAAPLAGGGARYFGSNQGGTIYQSTAAVAVTQTGAPAGATPIQ